MPGSVFRFVLLICAAIAAHQAHGQASRRTYTAGLLINGRPVSGRQDTVTLSNLIGYFHDDKVRISNASLTLAYFSASYFDRSTGSILGPYLIGRDLQCANMSGTDTSRQLPAYQKMAGSLRIFLRGVKSGDKVFLNDIHVRDPSGELCRISGHSVFYIK